MTPEEEKAFVEYHKKISEAMEAFDIKLNSLDARLRAIELNLKDLPVNMIIYNPLNVAHLGGKFGTMWH